MAPTRFESRIANTNARWLAVLSGTSFNSWTVTGGSVTNKRIECTCKCGRTALLTIKEIRRSRSKDCGCGTRDRTAATNIARYGVDNVAKAPEIAASIKATNVARYGAERPFLAESLREKVRATRRAGQLRRQASATAPRIEVRVSSQGFQLLESFSGYQNVDRSWKEYKLKHIACSVEFQSPLYPQLSCPVCNSQSSQGERDLLDAVRVVSPDAEARNRTVVAPLELDVYVPSKNLAFEYNGIFYHSDKFKARGYHKEKSERCLEAGVRLYHVWGNLPAQVVHSKIRCLLGAAPNRLFARKLRFAKIAAPSAKKFFNRTHLHGWCPASATYGLMNGDKIVQALSFRRYGAGKMEIARHSTELDTVVVGGFSRLLKHCLPLLPTGTQTIVSFAYRDWSPDPIRTAYFKAGFVLVGATDPSMRYVKRGETFHRQEFQKHKLKALFPDLYEESKTAKVIMEEAGYLETYDSGNWKFELSVGPFLSI